MMHWKSTGGTHARKAMIVFLSAWLLLLCSRTALSENVQGKQAAPNHDPQVVLAVSEWSWEGNAVCTLSGSLKAGNADLRQVTLVLKTETEPETADSERIVFTEVNGDKIRLRRQSNTWTAEEILAGEELPFTVSWFLPEETLNEATVRLLVTGPEGTKIGSAELKEVNELAELNGPWRIPVDLNRLTLILGITTGIVWFAAIVRILICQRKIPEEK